jgi:hypothetical protein
LDLFPAFANRYYNRREGERNEALARVEAMIMSEGGPTKQVCNEVSRAVDKGLDMTLHGLDLNVVRII